MKESAASSLSSTTLKTADASLQFAELLPSEHVADHHFFHSASLQTEVSLNTRQLWLEPTSTFFIYWVDDSSGFTFAHAWIYLCSVIKVAVATIWPTFVSSTTMT